jgi:hypothetical protein
MNHAKHLLHIKHTFFLLSVALLFGFQSPLAIGAPEPEESPASKPPPLPTLDELLGLENEMDGTDAVQDANDAELEEMLDAKQAGEAFAQAVTLMDRVASRIGTHQDLSITTQRLQEDILSKLDQVIESAQNNQSGGGGSSSSSQSSSSQQNQPDQQQPKPGEDASGSTPASSSGDSPMPAGSSDARPGDEIAPDGVSWGALPARFREALSQGISDRYSELYRSITEQYYKSLAEDEE